MATFAFRFEPVYKVLAAPFGILPATTAVGVEGGELKVRFGPWSLSTPLSNIEECQTTGPFSVVKTAGPPHLSLADRGLTCATNRDAGLCITFTEAVPGIDPLGRIRHPGLTVTVDRVEDLRRALTEDLSTEELATLSDTRTSRSPWKVLSRTWGPAIALVVAVGRLRSRRRRHRRRRISRETARRRIRRASSFGSTAGHSTVSAPTSTSTPRRTGRPGPRRVSRRSRRRASGPDPARGRRRPGRAP